MMRFIPLCTKIGKQITLFSFWLKLCYTQTNEDFGRPRSKDCIELWGDAMQDQDLSTRWYDEEQALVQEDLGWPGIQNTLDPPVVQLPKYFSLGAYTFRQSRSLFLYLS